MGDPESAGRDLVEEWRLKYLAYKAETERIRAWAAVRVQVGELEPDDSGLLASVDETLRRYAARDHGVPAIEG